MASITRLAYTESLPDERKGSAIAFTRPALVWFQRFGISVERLITDNGSAYKSFAYRNLLRDLGTRQAVCPLLRRRVICWTASIACARARRGRTG